MTDTSPTNASPDAPATIGVRIGVGLTYGMFAIAGLMGLLVLYAGLRLIVTGEQHWGVGLLVTAMGVIFAGLGIVDAYRERSRMAPRRAKSANAVLPGMHVEG